MTTDHSAEQAPGVTPPSDPAEVPPPPSTWPTAIGVIAIVLGGVGALGGCVGAFLPLFMGMMQSIAPKGQVTGLEGMMDWVVWIVAVSIAAMPIAVLLLVAGIGITKRRAWGPKVALVWAGLKMIFVIVHSVASYLIQIPQFEAMQEAMANDPNMPAGMGAFLGSLMQAFGIFGVLIGVLWGWALPVFLFIWFARKKIRTETAGWAAPTGQPY